VRNERHGIVQPVEEKAARRPYGSLSVPETEYIGKIGKNSQQGLLQQDKE